MTIYIKSYSKYGAALYIGCWSCTNYGAARASPAVQVSPPMALEVCSRRGAIQIHVYLYLYLLLLHAVSFTRAFHFISITRLINYTPFPLLAL